MNTKQNFTKIVLGEPLRWGETQEGYPNIAMYVEGYISELVQYIS